MTNDGTPETYKEFLAAGRAVCRNLEALTFEQEVDFRYRAREPWWAFIEKTQKMADFILSFKDFWDNPETYPRTIASDSPKLKSKD
jgi:hypothetical protein